MEPEQLYLPGTTRTAIFVLWLQFFSYIGVAFLFYYIIHNYQTLDPIFDEVKEFMVDVWKIDFSNNPQEKLYPILYSMCIPIVLAPLTLFFIYSKKFKPVLIALVAQIFLTILSANFPMFSMLALLLLYTKSSKAYFAASNQLA